MHGGKVMHARGSGRTQIGTGLDSVAGLRESARLGASLLAVLAAGDAI